MPRRRTMVARFNNNSLLRYHITLELTSSDIHINALLYRSHNPQTPRPPLLRQMLSTTRKRSPQSSARRPSLRIAHVRARTLTHIAILSDGSPPSTPLPLILACTSAAIKGLATTRPSQRRYRQQTHQKVLALVMFMLVVMMNCYSHSLPLTLRGKSGQIGQICRGKAGRYSPLSATVP